MGQLIQHQRLAVQLLFLLEPDVGTDSAGRLDVIQLYFFNALRTRGGLLGLGGVRREATDKLLKIGNFSALLGILRLLTLASGGRCHHKVVVVAWINSQFSIVDIRHMGAHCVEEMSIMRNDNHRTLTLIEHSFQPSNCIDIEVVGGLVKQQYIRIRKQSLSQQHTQFPARRHLAH